MKNYYEVMMSLVKEKCVWRRKEGKGKNGSLPDLGLSGIVRMCPHLGLGGPVQYGSHAIHKRLEGITHFVPIEGKSVLDVGCGNGAYTIEIARKAGIVVGVDIEKSRLSDFCKIRGKRQLRNISILQMDGLHLAFRNEQFDVVTAIDVMEHIPDEQKFLSEIFRVLKPRGSVALSLPNKWYLFESHGAKLGGVTLSDRIPFVSWLPTCLHSRIARARIYTKTKGVDLLKRAGFREIKVDYIYPPVDTLPAPFRFRLLLRRFGEALEQTPFRVFGVSIIMVAQKRV